MRAGEANGPEGPLKMCSAVSVQDVDERRREFATDLLAVAGILKKAPQEHVGELTMDCECTATLFACVSPESVIAKQVIAAQEHVMNRVRLARLQTVLTESPAGVEIMATVEAIARGSANDALADAGFKNALSCFKDGAMLRICRSVPTGVDGEDPRDATELVIKNRGLVVDSPMMITGLLREAMSQVLESASLWSPVQRGHQAEDIHGFAKQLAETVGSVDLTLGCSLFRAVFEPCRSISELEDAPHDAAADMLRNAASGWSMLVRCVNTSSTKELLTSCANLRDKLHAPGDWDLKVLSGMLDGAKHNERVRDAVRVLLGSIQKVVDCQIPSSPSDMVDQWVARGSDSFLCSSLAVLQNAKDLEGLGNFKFGALALSHDETDADGEPLTVRFDDDEPDSGPTIAAIVSWPVAVAQAPVVAWCKCRLTAAVGTMTDNFLSILNLPAWKSLTADVNVKDMSLHEIAHQFVDSSLLTASIARTTAFLTAPGAPPVMPATAAFEQIVEMIDTAELDHVPWKSPGLAGATTSMAVDRFVAWCEVLVRMYHVACVLAWIKVTCNGGACVTNGMLKPEMERAISALTENVEAGVLALNTNKDLLVEVEQCVKQVYMPGVLGCSSWLKAARDATPAMAELMLASVGANIAEQAQRLKASIPTIDHYLNDTTFNTRLIKSKLVGYDRAPLTDQSVLIWKSLSDAGRLREKFDMCSNSSEAFLEEPLAHGLAAFRAAKRLLAIVVGVDVLYKATGSARAVEAKKLLATKADQFPKTLLAELEKATTGVASNTAKHAEST